MNLLQGDFQLAVLSGNDAQSLGMFFDTLSDSTRALYGPHPLHAEYANTICDSIPEHTKTRFVVKFEDQIVGYFLFDFDHYPHEYERYQKHGIHLNFSLDPVFAPCIADDFQGKGISSMMMPHLIKWGKSEKLRSFVLMGGTQEPNQQAQAFYRKFGFKEYEHFFTSNNGVNNIDMRLDL